VDRRFAESDSFHACPFHWDSGSGREWMPSGSVKRPYVMGNLPEVAAVLKCIILMNRKPTGIITQLLDQIVVQHKGNPQKLRSGLKAIVRVPEGLRFK
jgi:hypothetical protein